MWLLAGLGNPGTQYQNTRHNIGFMAAEAIARRHNFSPWKEKYQSVLAMGELGGEKVVLLKPQTFMNLSGQAVQAAAAFFKIPPERIVVLYDEIDLAAGKLRVKMGGGTGGHNGIKSIDSRLGQNYWRVRMGVGRPSDPRHDVSDYVLGHFAADDALWLEKLLDAVAQEAALLVKPDMEGFMTHIARNTQPPKPEKKPPEEKDGGTT